MMIQIKVQNPANCNRFVCTKKVLISFPRVVVVRRIVLSAAPAAEAEFFVVVMATCIQSCCCFAWVFLTEFQNFSCSSYSDQSSSEIVIVLWEIFSPTKRQSGRDDEPNG